MRDVTTGGERIGNQGYFYSPTVLADVPDNARMMYEERSGPVAPMQPWTDFDEVMEKANGLGVRPRRVRVHHQHRTRNPGLRALAGGAGRGHHCAISFAETPFGGVKESGIRPRGRHRRPRRLPDEQVRHADERLIRKRWRSAPPRSTRQLRSPATRAVTELGSAYATERFTASVREPRSIAVRVAMPATTSMMSFPSRRPAASPSSRIVQEPLGRTCEHSRAERQGVFVDPERGVVQPVHAALRRIAHTEPGSTRMA